MSAIPVYILAGGQSSRFGSDKARAEVHGMPMIKRLSVLLAPVAENITVVAECRHKYADLGLTTIPDEVPGLGPMGGLVTALQHRQVNSGTGWLLLCACDWAEIRTSWVEELVRHTDDQIDAVAFHDDRWQPLFALYHTRLLPEATRHARRHSRRMSDLLGQVSSRALSAPQGWQMRWQINSRADWQNHVNSCERSGVCALIAPEGAEDC